MKAGFDLTLVRYIEQVTPPAGYYALVVPHSSIAKHNVYFTNSVGVIDPTYTGSIKVVLSSTYYCAVNLWDPSVSAAISTHAAGAHWSIGSARVNTNQPGVHRC
jgi:deoxycytidine triphosphate deaminase